MFVMSLYRILRQEPGSDEWLETSVRVPGRARKRQSLFTMRRYVEEARDRVRPELPEGTRLKIQSSASGSPWQDVRA